MVFAVSAKAPTAVLLDTEFNLRVWLPIATVLSPDMFRSPANWPMDTLPAPLVVRLPALTPMATLSVPELKLPSVSRPMPMLSAPVTGLALNIAAFRCCYHQKMLEQYLLMHQAQQQH